MLKVGVLTKSSWSMSRESKKCRSRGSRRIAVILDDSKDKRVRGEQRQYVTVIVRRKSDSFEIYYGVQRVILRCSV